MFRLILAAAVVAVLGVSPALAQQSQKNKGGGSSGEFLGFTVATTDGNVGGIAGMNAFCEAEFGDNARFCTTEEYMRSRNQGVPTSAAWIHPVSDYVPFSSSTGLFASSCAAATGQNGSRQLIWSSDDPARVGIVVDTDGRVAVVTDTVVAENFTCDVARPVACCAR